MEQRSELVSQAGEKSLPPPPGCAMPSSGGREAGAGVAGVAEATGWWLCTHEGVGLPFCPTCDGRLPDDTRTALRQARAVLGLLGARLEVPEVTVGCAVHGDGLNAEVEAVESDGTICIATDPCPRCLASAAQGAL